MLQRLVMHSRAEHTIVSLTTVGRRGEELRAAGKRVLALGMSGLRIPLAIFRLNRLVGRIRPDVIKSWMYHGDLAAALANPRGTPPVVWGVHNANLDTANVKRTTQIAARICARLSHIVPARIVFDSRAAADVHVAIGYDARKAEIIPNGFDTAAWYPRPDARVKIRRELALPDDALLVGLVARFHPMKDHRTFLEAAVRIRREYPQTQFILCGGVGIEQSNLPLTSMIDDLGLRSAVHILGRRDDLPTMVASLDISVSSSLSESFPLAVGESMAAGVPCVVTDVGDSAYLLGEQGAVVPPRDPGALAAACVAMLRRPLEERLAVGQRERDRIKRRFSIDSTVRAYEELFERTVASALGER